jgi:hypothetical protein
MENEWVNLQALSERLDQKFIIGLHKEQIQSRVFLMQQDYFPVSGHARLKEEIRLWKISLFRNVNGFDPVSELPAGWEDSIPDGWESSP